jgi:hypothetical protein
MIKRPALLLLLAKNGRALKLPLKSDDCACRFERGSPHFRLAPDTGLNTDMAQYLRRARTGLLHRRIGMSARCQNRTSGVRVPAPKLFGRPPNGPTTKDDEKGKCEPCVDARRD